MSWIHKPLALPIREIPRALPALKRAAAGAFLCLTAAGAPAPDDPLIEKLELKAFPSRQRDHLGSAITVDGNTAVVAAIRDEDRGTDSGSVYVYTRVFGSWTQQVKLHACDGAASDSFGFAVSLVGDLLLVGAPYDDDLGVDSGSVYVFERNGIEWTQTAKLNAPVSGTDHRFGSSIAMLGNTALIGAPGYGNGRGRVYVLERSGGAWSHVQTLKALSGAGVPGSEFGAAVAAAGNTAIIGSPSENLLTTSASYDELGAARIFTRSGGVWTRQATLRPSDRESFDHFGHAVAITSGVALIGAPDDDIGLFSDQGSAYVFRGSGSTWTEEARLIGGLGTVDAHFGTAVAICYELGTQIRAIVGSPEDGTAGLNAGAAYTFRGLATGGVWSSDAVIVPGAAGDQAGSAVAMDVSAIGTFTAIVGLPQSDLLVTDSGAAVAYTRTSASSWSMQGTMLEGDDRSSDNYGYSMKLRGSTLIVGATGDDDRGSGAGAAHIHVRNGSGWVHQAKCVAYDARLNDGFGYDVAVDGDTAVVGAPMLFDGRPGAVYVFVRTGTSWSCQAKLEAPFPSPLDKFGSAVAIYGDRIVVGDPGDDDAGFDSGAAYVFLRTGSMWSLEAKLTDPGGAEFGSDVSLDGNTALIGSWGSDSWRGAAYAFARSGGAWSLEDRIVASDGVASDRFGIAVSLVNGAAAIGADGRNSGAGAVYVARRTAGGWSSPDRIGNGTSTGDRLGRHVDVGYLGKAVIAGAPYANSSQGYAVVLCDSGSSWSEQVLTASDGAINDSFGRSVELGGASALVGSPGHDHLGIDAGTAYWFVPAPPLYVPTPWIENLDDLDSFGPGMDPAQPSTHGWQIWDHQSLTGAVISHHRNYSTPHSLFIGGDTDVIMPFDISSGRWTMRLRMFVPTAPGPDQLTRIQRIGLLNEYAALGQKDWAVQLEVDPIAGVLRFGAGPLQGQSTLLVENEWAELAIEIDLGTNTAQVHYGPDQAAIPFGPSFTWAPSGHTKIEALSLFANQQSLAPNPDGGVYFDEFELIWWLPDPTTYCMAKPTVACGPSHIVAQGYPSATLPNGFSVSAAPSLGQKMAIGLYGVNGRAAIPFLGGTLCIQAPLRRTTVLMTGGTPGQCDGVLSIDFNAFAQGSLGGNPGPELRVPGTMVNAQFWARDTVHTGSLLTDAVEWTIGG